MKILLTLASLLFVQFAFAQVSDADASQKVWSLEDCIAYALENNITVKDATLNKNIAEADYNKAKSARLPNLFGNASQSFSNGNTIDPITSDFVTDQIHSTNTTLSGSVILFQGNQLNNQVKQNKLFLEQSVFEEEVEKNNIVLNLLEVYLQTLYSKESVTIAQNNLEASQKEVLRSKALLDAGSITLKDYSEAQSQAASNQYELITAKNNYQQYIIDLKQLLELPPAENIEIETIDENTALVQLTENKYEIYKAAINYLPELKASTTNMLASEKGLDIAQGSYLPTLTLNGSIGSGYTSINESTFSDQFNVNFNQRLSVSLTVPIFNLSGSNSPRLASFWYLETRCLKRADIYTRAIM